VIPYLHEPTLKIGSVTLHAFGVFVAAAVLVGCWLALRRAQQQGLDQKDTTHLLLWMLGLGFLVSHLESLAFSQPRVFATPSTLWSNPLLWLNLWNGMCAFGGILGGILGGLIFLKRRGWAGSEVLLRLDGVAFAFPFAWSVARAGCSLVHDHPGIHTASWLAVRYPDGPRYDLGLLDFFCALLLAALFLYLDRRRRPRGFYLALFLVLYAPARLLLDNLRHEERFLGLTSGQYGAVLAMVAGLVVLRALAGKSPPGKENRAAENTEVLKAIGGRLRSQRS
jgi:phosphatidylglycerol:prolipoprotein diacylglycerol transferase